MIYIECILFIPTPSPHSPNKYQPLSVEVEYEEEPNYGGAEYATAVDATRASLQEWAHEGEPSAGSPKTQPHFQIIRVHDEWGDFALPIPPCLRCGDDAIEYRIGNETLCAYCNHMTNKD